MSIICFFFYYFYLLVWSLTSLFLLESFILFSLGETHTEIFDCVLLASGHHATPHFPPKWPGQDQFKGRIMHAHSYKDHTGFEDQVAVVVGIGNSSLDISVELSRICRKVTTAGSEFGLVETKPKRYFEQTE